MAEKDLANEEVKEEQAAVEATENVTEASENEESTVNGATDNFIEDATPSKGKKKGIIIAVAAVILVAALAVCGYFIYQNSKVISLITDTVTVEYGESYTPNVVDFVEESKINDSYTITGELTYADDTEYPTIGEYTFVISADGKNDAEVTVIVSDTVAPIFGEDSPSGLSVYQDVELTEEDLQSAFTVEDVDTVSLSIDDEAVDYTTAGEYIAIVYAVDTSGNVSEVEVTVTVKEPTINIEQANVSLTVGETATLNTTVQGASQDVTYSSSDESVATVDENGVVTAVKAGTATITAEANGVSSTVNITVEAKSSSSSSSSSGSNSSSNSSSSSKNSSSSSSSGSSSSSKNSSSSSSSSSSGSSSSSSGSSSSSSSSIAKNFCTNGGSTHVIDTYESEGWYTVGWYSSRTEARSAITEYGSTHNGGISNYMIQQCSCGLYGAFIKFRT